MPEERDEFAEEEVCPLPTDIIDKIKAKHQTKLTWYETQSHGVFVFKKPTKAVFYAFMERVQDDESRNTVAFEEFAGRCFVYPELADGKPNIELFRSAVEDEPALPAEIGGRLAKLAGLRGGKNADPKYL